jgi:hypothetical protein
MEISSIAEVRNFNFSEDKLCHVEMKIVFT